MKGALIHEITRKKRTRRWFLLTFNEARRNCWKGKRNIEEQYLEINIDMKKKLLAQIKNLEFEKNKERKTKSMKKMLPIRTP